MNAQDWLSMLERGGRVAPGLGDAVFSLLLAFVLGQVAAWIYMYTHQGLSYSRSFVQSIVMLTMLLSVGMMVIGNNIIIAFGLIGALSVIRFRNILKDTRDTAFMFFALITGMATGTGYHGLAVLGTIAFGLVLLYLYWTRFGDRDTGDAFLRFESEADQDAAARVREVLDAHCRSVMLVSQRFHETGGGESSYRLALRDARRAGDLVASLRNIQGIHNVSFVLQEDQAEL